MERIERMGTSFDARFFSTVQVPHTHIELGSAISSDVAHAGCSARRHAAQKYSDDEVPACPHCRHGRCEGEAEAEADCAISAASDGESGTGGTKAPLP